MDHYSLTRRTALKLLGVGAAATGAAGTVGGDGHTMTTDDLKHIKDDVFIAKLGPQAGVETDAKGLAAFQHRDDELTFVLLVSNVEDTFMTHIHENEVLGPIVVWLHDFETQDEELIPGRFDGILDAGTITDDVIAAGRVPEADTQTVAQLRELIRAGDAYVNLHTEAYPDGEIAGRIKPLAHHSV